MEGITIDRRYNSIYNTKKFLDYNKKSKYHGKFPPNKNSNKRKPKRPICNKLTLACGREVNRVRENNIKAILEFPIEPIIIFEEPVVLARVEVDLECFKRPVVTLDFSTFIQVVVDDNVIGIVLDLRLKRICNGKEYVLKDYEFTRFIQIGFGPRYDLRDTFKILYCDNPICKSECCEYIVEFTGYKLIGTGRFVEEISELVIEDSFIRAIIQDLC